MKLNDDKSFMNKVGCLLRGVVCFLKSKDYIISLEKSIESVKRYFPRIEITVFFRNSF